MISKRNRDIYILMSRCELLESLGFAICHNDSWVTHESVPNCRFDFSAINTECFVKIALQIAFEYGVKSGKKQIRDEFKNLMGCNDDESNS